MRMIFIEIIVFCALSMLVASCSITLQNMPLYFYDDSELEESIQQTNKLKSTNESQISKSGT